MNIDNLKSQMRKGMLEFCVLLILKRGDAYASEMIARLKEAQGPPRKYYSITPVGHQFLEQLQQSWDEILSSVSILQSDYTNKYLPQ